ncbi:uncharacterized protein CEXT_344972 [Caerostris extrusa]|uniref:Uncharacterized protein n=1 Tax=Caerostris extrusa TaxID=172846 RepID=A0AAV4PB28_CAEEX|nr:uncharacterized protein CEXT_344972 [Caerostris extrusa]
MKFIVRENARKQNRLRKRLGKAVKESAENNSLIEKCDMVEKNDMENEHLNVEALRTQILDVKNFIEINASHEMHLCKCIAVSLELCELYHQAIRELIGYHPIEYVKRYFNNLKSVTNRWCQFKEDCSLFNKLRCNTHYYRIAYIYRNSTCLSSAVAHYFGIFLSQHTNIVTELLHRDEIRICSVGGGSTSDVFQEVHSLINPGSVLFLLDFAASNIVKACGGSLGDLPEYELLYEAPFDSYTLHISVVEKHLLLYGHMFGTNICNTMFKAFCRVWVKYDNILAVENIKMETVGFEERVLRKKIKKFKSFCDQFQNLSGEIKINSYQPWKEYFSVELEKKGYREKQIQKGIRQSTERSCKVEKIGKTVTD